MSLRETRARKAQLIQRIAQQRSEVKVLAHAFEQPFSFIDKGYLLIQKLRKKPKLAFFGFLFLASAFRKPVIRKSAVLLSMAEWLLLKK